MRKINTTIMMLVSLALFLAFSDQVWAAEFPAIADPPAPASNLAPPKAFIGMLIAFLCFFLVVGVNLIPSKRSDDVS
ncbi:MAG: hypothetical protein MK089_08805 [Phycisphaerales bacterium]|nr:hypothetical protein [Phycisphaerales bacterium]